MHVTIGEPWVNLLPPPAEISPDNFAPPAEADASPASAQLSEAMTSGYDSYNPAPQSPTLLLNEARTVYLTNLERRAEGLGPIRWNRNLTYASRWFAWDSVENRAGFYCGHQDTLGGWPSDRVPYFGYRGFGGAENAICWGGFLPSPEQAVESWMNSPGHRGNILDPNHREIGLGYYLRQSDLRGYGAQKFGVDPAYRPVIIENEALTTTNSTVQLYIYGTEGFTGIAGANTISTTRQMMVSENPCFVGASWEPYQTQRSWTFSGAPGWRTLYVRHRDALGLTMVSSDTIYFGSDVPLHELDRAMTPLPGNRVRLYHLRNWQYPYVQFSMQWLFDDTHSGFNLWWGSGERVNDSQARGGTAFRLNAGPGEAFAWIADYRFPHKDTPFIAYFRLKVSDNSSPNEVARISVKGGGVEYGPLQLKGTDFTAANQYQHFALPFTFHNNSSDRFLIFQFWRSGNADVFVDGVFIFTVPQPLTGSTMEWQVPFGNYRGQGIWVRYTDGTPTGTSVSPIYEAKTMPLLQTSQSSVGFLKRPSDPPPPPVFVPVVSPCGAAWQATASAPWIQIQQQSGGLSIGVNPTGLGAGRYTGVVTLTLTSNPQDPLVRLPVTLSIANQIYRVHLPLVRR